MTSFMKKYACCLSSELPDRVSSWLYNCFGDLVHEIGPTISIGYLREEAAYILRDADEDDEMAGEQADEMNKLADWMRDNGINLIVIDN